MAPRQPKTGRETINHGGMSLVDVRLPGAKQYLRLFHSMQHSVCFYPIKSCRPLICMLVVKCNVILRIETNIRIVVFNFRRIINALYERPSTLQDMFYKLPLFYF